MHGLIHGSIVMDEFIEVAAYDVRPLKLSPSESYVSGMSGQDHRWHWEYQGL